MAPPDGSPRDAGEEVRPLVSVVTPCYGQAHLLADAIESVLAQSYPAVEMVVVDDGSPDDPGAVAARYPQVRLLRQANRGRSAARNAGLAASRGEYVVFLDADDVLLPHAVETGVRELAARPAVAFVHGFCEKRRLDGTPLTRQPTVVGEVDLYMELLRGNCVRGLHGVVFRRTAVDAVGGFDEAFPQAQDWELYLRLARRFPTYGHGELVGVYRRHDGNVNSLRHTDRMLRSSLAVLRAQRPHIRGSAPHADAYRAGVRYIQHLFGEPLVRRLVTHVRARQLGAAARDAATLLRHYPRGILSRVTGKVRRIVGLRHAGA